MSAGPFTSACIAPIYICDTRYFALRLAHNHLQTIIFSYPVNIPSLVFVLVVMQTHSLFFSSSFHTFRRPHLGFSEMCWIITGYLFSNSCGSCSHPYVHHKPVSCTLSRARLVTTFQNSYGPLQLNKACLLLLVLLDTRYAKFRSIQHAQV